MTNFIWKWFGLSRIKSLLDKIPANGQKTSICYIIILLSAISAVAPQYQDVIGTTVDYLEKSYEINPVETVTAVSAFLASFVTLGHKVLKFAEKIVDHLNKKEIKN